MASFRSSPELSAYRLFDATLSAIRDFAYTFDRNGRFLYANKALLDLWGLRLEEAVGKNFFELNYPEALAATLQAQIQQVFDTQKTIRDETPYVSSAGVYGYYEYIFSPVFNENGDVEIVAGSTRDITKHKQIQEELRLVQQRTDAALASGKAGTWIWDLVEDRIQPDRNMAKIFGFPAGEIVSTSHMNRFHAMVHPDDRERNRRTLNEAVASGHNYYSEYRIVVTDKQLRWIEARGMFHQGPEGKIQSMTGTVVDVTDRKNTERNLHFLSDLSLRVSGLMSEEEITQHTLAAVGTYLQAHRAYFFEALPQPDRVLVAQDWNRPDVSSLAGEYNVFQFETATWWDAVRKSPVRVNDTRAESDMNAERFAVLQIRAWATVPYSREGTWVAGFAITSAEPREWTKAEIDLLGDVMARIWPMVERVRLRVALEQSQRELAQANQDLEARVHERTVRLKETIEELEAFSYSISHDLRAPLRAMQGYAGILLETEHPLSPDERREYLERIKRASERLDHLINDILRYTRVSRAEVTLGPVDLNVVIGDTIREYPQLHDARVGIQLSPLPLVLGHEVLLSQCVSNLLINAVKFVPPGKLPLVKIWGEERGTRLRIWIQDNGIGLEPQHLTRIFGMFERVNPPQLFEGTGIGLTIVKRAMDRMDGNVGVESVPNDGSRFWLELPRV